MRLALDAELVDWRRASRSAQGRRGRKPTHGVRLNLPGCIRFGAENRTAQIWQSPVFFFISIPLFAVLWQRVAGPGVTGGGAGSSRRRALSRFKPEVTEESFHCTHSPWSVLHGHLLYVPAPSEARKRRAQWRSDCVSGCSCHRLPWDGTQGVRGQWMFWPSGG